VVVVVVVVVALIAIRGTSCSSCSSGPVLTRRKVERLGHKQRHRLLDELPADGVGGVGDVDPEECVLRVDRGGLEDELACLPSAPAKEKTESS
jgi:hypothetical protein